MKIKIGVSAKSYLELRNFIDLPYKNELIFKKSYDFYKPYNHFLFKVFKKIDPDKHFSFYDSGLVNVDAFHFFSTIYFGRRPWFVTSSVVLPRWTKNIERGYAQLAKPNCKKIIFLSELVYNRQLSELSRFPAYQEAISKKMMVLSPSQPCLISEWKSKKLNPGRINFVLVGHQVLIKGGYEVLKTIKKLYDAGYKVNLFLISQLHESSFIVNKFSKERIEEIKQIIEEGRGKFVEYFAQLENEKVLQIIRDSHIGLLPSYGDSYGYSVLEFQSCGCPVITTDVMALPEINNDQLGWVIKMPRLEFGKPDVFTDEKYLYFSQLLEQRLYSTMEDILKTPAEIEIKGTRSLNKIREFNAPERNAAVLEEFYTTLI